MKASRILLAAAAVVTIAACEQTNDPTGVTRQLEPQFIVVPNVVTRHVTVCKDAPSGSFSFSLSGLNQFNASVSNPFSLNAGQCQDIGIGGSAGVRGSVTVTEAATAGFNADSVQIYQVITDVDNPLAKPPVYISTSTALPLSATVQPGTTPAADMWFGYVIVFYNSAEPPPPPPTGCTVTLGFWKNHSSAWPVGSLTLGTTSYSAAQLLSIFNTPPKGNGLIQLAHQLIAAKLNIAAGADPSAINSAISAADALIGSLVVPPVGNGSLDPSVTSALITQLDNFNTGLTGPGHCPD